MHGRRDRHLDPHRRGQAQCRPRRLHPLRDLRGHVCQNLLQLPAPGQLIAQPMIPALAPGTRRHQVSHSRQPAERLRPGPQRDTQTCHLGQAPRDEGGLRIVAEAEAIADAGADGDDILQHTAQLDPQHIRIRVHAEPRRAQGSLHLRGEGRILRGGDGHGCMSRRDLGREVRPREDGETRGTRGAKPVEDGDRKAVAGGWIEALRRADQHLAIGQDRSKAIAHLAHPLRGNCEDDEPGAGHRLPQLRRGGHALGDLELRQVVGVAPVPRDGLGQPCPPRPEADRPPGPAEGDAQGRPPAPRPDHRDEALPFVHPSAPSCARTRSPILDSLPSSNRPRFGICRRMMSAAMAVQKAVHSPLTPASAK